MLFSRNVNPRAGMGSLHCFAIIERYWQMQFKAVRKWWNWQTHHLEGVAPKGVGVQIPPSAP